MTDAALIPGPSHPDMFDGESPIMLPLDKPLQAYEVSVTYLVTEHESRTVVVAARNEEEAARLAQQRVEDHACEEDHDHDVEMVTLLDRPANAAEKRAWLARDGGAQ